MTVVDPSHRWRRFRGNVIVPRPAEPREDEHVSMACDTSPGQGRRSDELLHDVDRSEVEEKSLGDGGDVAALSGSMVQHVSRQAEEADLVRPHERVSTAALYVAPRASVRPRPHRQVQLTVLRGHNVRPFQDDLITSQRRGRARSAIPEAIDGQQLSQNVKAASLGGQLAGP